MARFNSATLPKSNGGARRRRPAPRECNHPLTFLVPFSTDDWTGPRRAEKSFEFTLTLSSHTIMSADETTSAQTRFFVDRLGDGAIKEFRVTSTQSFFTPFDPIAAAFCSAVLTFQFASYQRLEMNAWLIATILISCFVIYSKVNRVKDGISFLLYFLIFSLIQFMAVSRSESVLVIKELGIQLKKRYFTGRERNSFIDANRIESVVLSKFQVFRLAVVCVCHDGIFLRSSMNRFIDAR
jgi:hypothetical protein